MISASANSNARSANFPTRCKALASASAHATTATRWSKIKTDWFAQWASWTFGLEPGSLEVTPHGEDRADPVFAMAYDNVPKDKAAARLTGKARVTLGLVRPDGQWRIRSESSEALK